MTQRENRVRQCELDVRVSESKVAEAKSAMDNGYKRLKAEFDAAYDKLKQEYQRASIHLEQEMAHLETAKSAADQPYSHNED